MSVPKNLKQVVKYLQLDCSDSLKTLIKQTSDKELFKISYPAGGDYKTIYNWLNGKYEEKRLGKYLIDKGITYYDHQTEIILLCFKKFLVNNPIDEKAIIKPYRFIESKWVKEDSLRFTTDSLRGYYIPKDIHDCFRQVDKLWSDSIKMKVKSWSEDEFFGKTYRFGLGLWMRNNWQLWGGSRLTAYFNKLGVYNAESMSGIILNSYHKYLKGEDIKLEEQADENKAIRARAVADDSIRKVKEFATYNLGDTVNFDYKLRYVSKQQELKADKDVCHAKGIITAKNEKYFWLKVKIIETCDKKGIVIYDNEGTVEYSKKLKRFTEPKKRIIKRGFINKEYWFNYESWEPKDN